MTGNIAKQVVVSIIYLGGLRNISKFSSQCSQSLGQNLNPELQNLYHLMQN